jgi:proteasome lid subunit RPN8/RPN11
MIEVNDKLLADIKAHAEECLPNESCGLIVNDGTVHYVRCINTAVEGSDFRIDPEQYADFADRYDIIGIAHSHPQMSCQPSMADLVGCETSGLPWLIMNMPSGEWMQFEPSGYEAPYLERPFVMGVLDCYALVRDWSKRERQIDLPNIPRKMNFWRNPANNYFVDNYLQHGFESIPLGSKPMIGDVFLMQIRSSIPNHCAVYIGEGRILQHCLGQLSQRYVYGGTWAHLTTHHLRHA